MATITVAPEASSDTAFLSALAQAKTAIRPNRIPGGDPIGTTAIQLAAGDYDFSTLKGFLGAEGSPTNTQGIVFRGAGSALTSVYFNPATSGPLCYNQGWVGVRFEGIRFVALRPDCMFLQSNVIDGSGYNTSDCVFVDCGWEDFQYVVDLTGNNNNDTFRFFGCYTNHLQNNGAWLHIGPTNTSDQFLHHSFYGCKHLSTSAPIIQAYKGGHFHIYGMDASSFGGAGNSQLFQLYTPWHGYGVPSLTVHGLRSEIKSATSGLLHSEWGCGNVLFQGCDIGSQAWAYNYGPTITLNFGPGMTTLYSFRDSMMAGTLQINGTPPPACSVLFSSCNWFGQNSAQAVCPNRFGGVVEFERCNTATGGAVRWT
jgi:hypothetical protein